MQRLQGRTVLPFGEFNKLSPDSCYLGRQTPFRATITVCHVFPSGSLSTAHPWRDLRGRLFFFYVESGVITSCRSMNGISESGVYFCPVLSFPLFPSGSSFSTFIYTYFTMVFSLCLFIRTMRLRFKFILFSVTRS